VYAVSAIAQVGGFVADENDQTLLDRVVTGLRDFVGQPGHRQIKSNAEWVRQQFEADPALRHEYLQAAVTHPDIFQDDVAAVSNVKAVVGHFARDGLTRSDYFKALAAEPLLLRQKPAALINNIEAVLDHYAADQPMRTEFLQAAVEQPVLFRTPPQAVVASIEAAVDRLEAQGVTRSDLLRQADDRTRIAIQGPEALQARSTLATTPPLPDAPPTGQAAASSPLPSTFVHNPALYVSYVDSAQGPAR
jgi:hypothetical protein